MAQEIKSIVERSSATLVRDALAIAGLFAMLFTALHAPVLF